MKSFGCVLAFTRERNAALLKAYREQVGKVRFVKLNEIGHKTVNSPSPRFWVSEERAAAVISALMRGRSVLDSMRPSKREMFEEIHRRVIALKALHPERHLSKIIHDVVNSPAPKFYMEASSALQIIFKVRKRSI